MKRQPNIIDWAWLAGIIDGEGCIGLYKRQNNTLSPQISIYNTNKAIIDKIHMMVPTFRIKHHRFKLQHAPITYCLYMYKQTDIKNLFNKIMPYLVGKREQAELLLEFVLRVKHSCPTKREYLIEEEIAKLKRY